jgi:hypothetical protein
MWRLNTELSSLGERRGMDWLIYNPIQMYAYHRLAKHAAGPAIAAIEEVVPTALTYVDVGAGSGAFAAEGSRRGKRVTACEHSLAGRLYARWQGVRSVPFELRSSPPAALNPPFDLAYCFEVAEHLPADLGDRLVGFLCDLAPVIVFSAAQPGQGGLAHLNEQPPEYWQERFRPHRYDFTPEKTASYQASVRRHGGTETWLLSNTMVYVARASGRD